MIDGKMLAIKHAETRNANKDAEEESQQGYGEPDAKMSYHVECMKKFIEAVHAKEPHEAHKAMVKYAAGEPDRKDQEGRDKHEEDMHSKPSSEEAAKAYRKANIRD